MAEQTQPWTASLTIAKTDAERRLVFGWLYVCRKANGEQVVDHSGETVSIEDLETATVDFALRSRKAGEMHEKDATGAARQVGRLVEVVCFTPEKQQALGIPAGVVPQGTWVGFKIDDDAAWEGVKSGRYKMLSLGGRAVRRSVGDA